MVSCAIYNCKSNNNLKATKNSESKVSFFSFPKNLTLQKLWLQKCQRKDKFNVAYARICSMHFTPYDYLMKYRILDYSPNIKRLNATAVPSLNLPCTDTKRKQTSGSVRNRINKRNLISNINHLLAENERLGIINDDNINESDQAVKAEETQSSITVTTVYNNIETQTDKIVELKQIIYKQELELQKLKAEAEQDEKTLSNIFTSGQIKKINSNMTKRIKWSANDIASAISLHAAGPRAYKLLQKRNYPLPALSTLRSWAGKINVNADI